VTGAQAGRVSGRMGTELLKRHFITKGSLSGRPATVPNCPRRDAGDMGDTSAPGSEGRQPQDPPRDAPEDGAPQHQPSQHWFWWDPTCPSTPGVPQLMAAPTPAYPMLPQASPCVPSCPVPLPRQDAQLLAGLNWCRHRRCAFTCSQPRWFCITLLQK